MPYAKSLFPSIPSLPAPTNIYKIFVEARPEVKAWSQHAAFVDGATGITRRYGELVQRIEDASAALAAPESQGGLGLLKGQHVGVLSENCIEYATITWALFKLAAPIVLMPASATTPETISLAKMATMTHLFVSPKLLPQGLAAAEALGLPKARVLILQGYVPSQQSLDGLIDLARRKKLKIKTREVQHDTPAYLMFSSGTSGRPKAIMSSHTNIYYSNMQSVLTSPIAMKLFPPKPLNTPEGIPVSIGYAPLYHILGFGTSIMRCFLQPVTIVMIPKWDTELVFKLIEKWKATTMVLVPAFVHMMLQSPTFRRVDLSSIGSVACGAAFLPAELRQRFSSRLNIPWWVETFGMSELTGAGLMAPPPGIFGSNVDPLPGEMILMPNFEGRVVLEDGTDADYDEPGELWLRGEAIALGYWDNKQATADTFLPDGWMRTGDRFRMDEASRFYFVERIKDTLKVSGTQVSPNEIEDTLVEQPDNLIIDAAVAGVQGDRMQGELVPHAWIVLSTKGHDAGAEKVMTVLDTWVKKQLSKPKWLRGGIEVVDEIPKSATGKVLRRVLQERYESARAGKVAAKL